MDGLKNANVAAFKLDADTNKSCGTTSAGSARDSWSRTARWWMAAATRRSIPQLDANYRPTNPALLAPDGTPLFGHLARGGD